MKKLKPIIDSLRLSMTIPAAFLVHAGFAISHQQTNWLLAILVFCIATMTMVQNDYFDRDHDLKKGKDFAFKNQHAIRNVLYIGWYLLIFISIFFLFQSFWQGVLLLIDVCIGIFYSFSRVKLLRPTFLVAVTSSSPALFAFSFLDNQSYLCLILFVSVFLVIFGREIIKDVEDEDIDVGYKKTILTEGIVDIESALKISACFIFLGSLASMFLFREEQRSLIYFLYLAGFCLCIGSSVLLFFTDNWKGARNILDNGVACIILSLSLLPLHL